MNFINRRVLGKLKSISELEQMKVLNPDNMITLRNKTKILLIDDDEMEVFDDLKSTYGYNIKQLPDLDDLDHAKAYQMIICDIHNVGRKFDKTSDLGGRELIKQLRKAYPEKYIVFFSSYNAYDGTIQECLNYTDDNIYKKYDSVYLSERLDNAIVDMYNPRTIWDNYAKYLKLHTVETSKIALIEDFYVRSVLSNKGFNEKELSKLFERNNVQIDMFKNFVKLATFVVGLL